LGGSIKSFRTAVKEDDKPAETKEEPKS
jgi:hypothetical protein